MKATIIHAYADENMDTELFKFETNEQCIPKIVDLVNARSQHWQHILITYPKNYISFDRKQWY